MNKPPDPNHVPGINKGEEDALSTKEPGRSNDTKNYRSARDSTGCDAKRREPIDPRMPNIPPA